MTELREILQHIEAIHELLLRMRVEETQPPTDLMDDTTEEEHKRTRSIWNTS